MGCAELPTFDVGECGNGILEPGEDCDSHAAGCIACRFSCAARENAAPMSCPAGWFCGVDTVCRRPSGDFEPDAIGGSLSIWALYKGDFDGDGRADVVVLDQDDVFAYFFGSDRELAVASRVPTPSELFTIGDLDGDRRDDLAVAFGDVDILRGTKERTLSPLSFPSFIAPSGTVRLVAFHGSGGRLAFGVLSGSTLYDLPPFGVSDFRPRAAMPLDAGNLGRAVAVANFDARSSSPCDELALVADGGTSVSIEPTCPDAPASSPTQSLSTVLLPSGVAADASGTFTGDVNGDSRPDLLVVAADKAATYVAYGVGDGTFHSEPDPIPSAGGDGHFAPQPLLNDRILAAGNLDGDARADFVLPDDVMMTAAPGPPCTGNPDYRCPPYVHRTWSAAAITDMNANGLTDLVAVSAGSRNVDFLNGAGGGRFNPAVIHTRANVKDNVHLVVGDFDGDLVIDLAYEQERDVSNSAPLAVLFGKAGAIPSDLLEVPAQGTIQDLASAYFAEDPDAMNDLVTVAASAGTNPSISAILGRSDRFLHSTLRVTDPRQTPPLPRFVSAVVAGRFIQTSPWNLVVISDPTRGGTTSALSLLASGRDLGQVLASIDLPSEPSGFVRLAAVDLDLDGVDELILVAYPNSNQISIVKPGAAMPAIAVVYSGGNGETFEASSVATNDVDGDGRPDLTVSATLDGRDVLEIFYNDGSGTLHPAARRAIALPWDTSPRFAWINVDSDAAKELAIVGGDTIVIAEIDRQSQGFTERLRLPAPITTPSSSVVSGDFDGDGIDDLACNGTGLQIYWGKAARSSP